MFSNVTRFDFLSAANNVSRTHAVDPPSGGFVEGLSGGVVAIAVLIGIMIAVRKRLEFVQGVLERILVSLTLIVNAMRKWLPNTPPPPPPNASTPRNMTDDEIIEMREMRERMDDHIDRQTDRDASVSVWI